MRTCLEKRGRMVALRMAELRWIFPFPNTPQQKVVRVRFCDPVVLQWETGFWCWLNRSLVGCRSGQDAVTKTAAPVGAVTAGNWVTTFSQLVVTQLLSAVWLCDVYQIVTNLLQVLLTESLNKIKSNQIKKIKFYGISNTLLRVRLLTPDFLNTQPVFICIFYQWLTFGLYYLYHFKSSNPF